MMSVVAFGALAYVVVRVTTNSRLRSAALAGASCAVAAISLSRVYLGVHWASDIVAGVAAGLVWLAAAIAAYEMRALPRAPRRPLSDLRREFWQPGAPPERLRRERHPAAACGLRRGR